MKKLNKKGFFMTETLMVIVFVTLIFTFLYVSVVPLIGTYNDKVVRESDIDVVYKLYSIRKAINKDINKNIMMSGTYNSIKCNNFNNVSYCNQLMEDLELSDYALIYTDNIGELYNKINRNEILVDKEIKEYLKDYNDYAENAIILLDKDKHSVTHLSFIDPDMPLGDLLEYKAERIARKTKGECKPLYTDVDGVIYFSGTNECVNFNYVWYSGKLWRITAIYPDGALKMVTENNITSIYFGDENIMLYFGYDNNHSYAYYWLNEEFYYTLYNAEEIIDTTKFWNESDVSSIKTKPSETNVFSVNVGLLNIYEYYNSYRCIENMACTGDKYETGYLKNGYYWQTLSPNYDFAQLWSVNDNGEAVRYDVGYAGVRPAIYLKARIEFSGSGTIDNPYRIVGDKPTGKVNDFINTRMSGEYIKLKKGNNEQLFRIIDVEDDKTKIIAMDYADNTGMKKFSRISSAALWGSEATMSENTWYTYLNDTYYPDLVNRYGELFDSSMYYFGTSGRNYKRAVCANINSGNTKVCNKTLQSGIFVIGLPRYGEMFATQRPRNGSTFIIMHLMNRYSASYGMFLYGGDIGSNQGNTVLAGARPTLHLKSTVRIKSGKGTYDNPYVVGL